MAGHSFYLKKKRGTKTKTAIENSSFDVAAVWGQSRVMLKLESVELSLANLFTEEPKLRTGVPRLQFKIIIDLTSLNKTEPCAINCSCPGELLVEFK
jgi:hypothetical protein